MQEKVKVSVLRRNNFVGYFLNLTTGNYIESSKYFYQIETGDYTIKDEKHLVNEALKLTTKDLNMLGIHDIDISSI